MTRKSFPTYFLAGSILLFPHALPAHYDNRDAVRDERGGVAVSSSGACVRTKWVDKNSKDPCSPSPMPKLQVHTYQGPTLTQEERTVYFEFNKAILTAQAKKRLDTLAQTLKSDSHIKEALIVGYADRIGSETYNEALSKKRAETVENYLVSQGYLNTRIAETRWLGEQEPVTQCDGTLKGQELIGCLQKDRRVEVEIEYQS